MFGFDHPWFAPLGRRIAVVAVCIIWGLVEAFTGAPAWAFLFLGAGGVAAWALLLNYETAGED